MPYTLYIIIQQYRKLDGSWANTGMPYTRKTQEGVDEVVRALTKFDPTCGGLVEGNRDQTRISIRESTVVSEKFV